VLCRAVLCCAVQGASDGDANSNQAAGADAGGGNDAATSELMRVFNKADFDQMQAVGQFNLGFIIAKLRGDLFIVDQHAAGDPGRLAGAAAPGEEEFRRGGEGGRERGEEGACLPRSSSPTPPGWCSIRVIL